MLAGITPARVCTTKYYSSTTLYDTVIHSTPRRSRESSLAPLALKANALSSRQILWAERIWKIVIANTMRRAAVQIQTTNVHTPRTVREAIPRAENLHFIRVLGIRRSLFALRVARTSYKICISLQLWTSEEHEVTKGLREDPTEFSFHHSFGRSICVEGCSGHVTNLDFTIVLGV